MASSKIRRALGAVKDQTSIGLAKVTNTSSVSDLDVAIVKATGHDEYPPEEKYIREILSLTCYSRSHISSCVSALSRRLGRTRSWTVALKTLILIHRLLCEGDPAYEQEIFFATRRGTRMLNMSEFRDTSRSGAWDFSAFVRTYALYLDERLDFRMHGRRAKHRARSLGEEEEGGGAAAPSGDPAATPVREMRLDRVFLRTKHLQQLLERFLACRPTGAARTDRIVAVALYPIVKESYQLYFDLQDIMNILVDQYMELELSDSIRIFETFCRLSKQFEELDHMYNWCKTAGISRPSEFPTVHRITNKKLEVMDELIREKSSLPSTTTKPDTVDTADTAEPKPDKSNILALPEPESESTSEVTCQEDDKMTVNTVEEEDKKTVTETDKKPLLEEADFLNLRSQSETTEEHGDKLALALFDGGAAAPAATSPWEAFDDSTDWEKALVVSASALSGQTASLGGGLDMTLLDGMYSQPRPTGETGGSASSVAVSSNAAQPMLALPAPPGSEGGVNVDPFAASLMVPAPTYVQMSEMEKKQQLLVGEQLMWQQYARDGMQGNFGMSNMQNYRS